jgi:hypothetical protein
MLCTCLLLRANFLLGDVRSKDRGIVPRLAEMIFEEYKDVPDQVLVSLSCLEIYQEKLRDLLPSQGDSSVSRSLRIRQDAKRGIWIEVCSAG